jgi:hypothetical protein
MKTQISSFLRINLGFIVLLPFIGLFLVGCNTNRPIKTVTNTRTLFPSSTHFQPTNTPPPPTPTPTVTPMLTLMPTMDEKQGEATIMNWLREPDTCGKPCFLGIDPGKTSRGEGKNILLQFGYQLGSTSVNGIEFDGIYHVFGDGLSINVANKIQQEIVQDISIDISFHNSQQFTLQDWFAFSPRSMIQRYGPPSWAQILIDKGGPSQSLYEMDLFFDQQDLIVQYLANYEWVAGSLRICPLTDNAIVHGQTGLRIWLGKDPENPPERAIYYYPLEKTASMSIEEFSALLLGDPEKACFNLNLDAYP